MMSKAHTLPVVLIARDELIGTYCSCDFASCYSKETIPNSLLALRHPKYIFWETKTPWKLGWTQRAKAAGTHHLCVHLIH